MSVKIRLKRAGTKGRPFYRVVVIDSRMQRDGRFVEELGYYDPLEKPQVVNVDREKVTRWIARGALPSDTVRTLLRRPNTTIEPRTRTREFTPGPPRVRVARPQPEAEAHAAQGDRRDRGGRRGGGRRGGEGRSGGGRGSESRGNKGGA